MGTPRLTVVAGNEGVVVPLAAAIKTPIAGVPVPDPRFSPPLLGVLSGVGHVAAAICTFSAALFRSNWLGAALFLASFVVGVLHAAVCICAGSGVPPAPNDWFGPPFSPSEARGVLHVIKPFNSGSSFRAPLRVIRPPCTSATVGVGHSAPV